MVTICDNSVMREMTAEEENIINNLPDPAQIASDPIDVLGILLRKGAKVSHNANHWISDVDGNVLEPGVYGWTEAE